jgi:hypothetical protein
VNDFSSLKGSKLTGLKSHWIPPKKSFTALLGGVADTTSDLAATLAGVLYLLRC